MKDPWEEISLSNYENYMKLDSVMQSQVKMGLKISKFKRNTGMYMYQFNGWIGQIDQSMIIANLLIKYISYI